MSNQLGGTTGSRGRFFHLQLPTRLSPVQVLELQSEVLHVDLRGVGIRQSKILLIFLEAHVEERIPDGPRKVGHTLEVSGRVLFSQHRGVSPGSFSIFAGVGAHALLGLIQIREIVIDLLLFPLEMVFELG